VGRRAAERMNLITVTAEWLTDPAQWTGPGAIPQRLVEHVGLSALSLIIAIAIALPAGLAIGHTRRGSALAANLANLGRAIPSLAVIGIVLPFTAAIDPQLGFKLYPTLVAMIILAIPPILVNAEAGVASVDADLVESSRAMGMGEGLVLAAVEIPVALPVILAGIRSGATQIVATMTLGAIFGSGGLGRFLVEGIAQNDDGKIFGGVVLVAALALATEAAFALLQTALTSPGLRSSVNRRAASGVPT
jgi:osmoprotectant transport system permease protein